MYVERVNRAIDHVVSHLAEPLNLNAVARAAAFSPYHFHRVFQSLMGESLAGFIKRLRLERALTMMALGPGRSLTGIALACGFSSSSDFSRCFRQRFGVAPSRFDIAEWRESHRSELAGVTVGAGLTSSPGGRLARLPAAENAGGFRVKIRALPARSVAYIRVRNPYRGDGVARATHRLINWARRHGLEDGQWLGYQWENPEITSLDDCQYHIAVEAERFTAKGEIGRFRFPAMVVAEVEVRGGIDLELRALQWLYGAWLPRSGYVPDDHPAFEAWIGLPLAHGTDHFELRVQLPVR